MEWSDVHAIGIATIDSQHKRLFDMFSELEEAVRQNQQVDIERLLKTMEQYKSRHFQLEEKYMEESGYPGLAEQQQAHGSFTNLFESLLWKLKTEGYSPALAREMKEKLSAWLEDHVTGLDGEFGEYYRKKEAGG